MAYFKASDTDEIHLPSDPTFWVKMKRRASFLDSEMARGSMIKISSTASNGHQPTVDDLISETEISAFSSVLISRLVVEWNLTDDSGQVVAITPANVGLLDAEDGQFLDNEAMKRLRRPEKEQAPFGKPSTRRSTGTK